MPHLFGAIAKPKQFYCRAHKAPIVIKNRARLKPDQQKGSVKKILFLSAEESKVILGQSSFLSPPLLRFYNKTAANYRYIVLHPQL